MREMISSVSENTSKKLPPVILGLSAFFLPLSFYCGLWSSKGLWIWLDDLHLQFDALKEPQWNEPIIIRQFKEGTNESSFTKRAQR